MSATVSNYAVNAMMRGHSTVVAGFTSIAQASARTSMTIEKGAMQAERAWARHQTTLSKLHAGYSRLREAGSAIGHVWGSTFHNLHRFTEEAMKLVRAQEKFKAIGLSDAENKSAFAAADSVTRAIKGAKLDETVETITDLHTAMGNLHHAMEALPMATKYRVAFTTLFGDKQTSEQLEANIQNGFKFMEMIGAIRATGPMDAMGKKAFTEEDKKRMESYFNLITKITAATGGRLDPSEMRQFASKAGLAAFGLTESGLLSLVGPLQEAGGFRIGTGLMSAFSAVVAGRMSVASMGEWERLGLVDHSKVEVGKQSDKIKKLKPGAITIGHLLQKDPLAFADALMAAMANPKKGPAIDTKNIEKVTEELSILFGNRTASQLIGLLTTQRDRVIKEAAIAAGAKDIEALYAQAMDSPMGKMRAFEASVDNFKIAVGLPLIQIGSQMMSSVLPSIDKLAKFFMMHPGAAKMAASITLIALGLKNLAKTMMVLRMAGFFNLFTGVGAGAAGSVGAAGVGGAVARQAGFAAKWGAPAAGVGAGAVGGIGIAAGLGIAAGIAAALWAGYKIFEGQVEDSSAQHDAEEAGHRLAEALKKGFENQINPGLSESIKKEMREAAAPHIVKDIITKQRAGYDPGFWRATPDFQNWLNQATPGASPNRMDRWFGVGTSPGGHVDPGAASAAQKVMQDRALARLRDSLYGSGISSKEDLGEYLKQMTDVLRGLGKGEQISTLEKAASMAFPQWYAQIEQEGKVRQELTDREREAAQAVFRFGGALSEAEARLRLFSPPGMLGYQPWSPGAPPSPKGFNFGSPAPGSKRMNFLGNSYAHGGLALSPQMATFAELGPELNIPLSQIGDLLGRRGGGGPITYAPQIVIEGGTAAAQLAQFRQVLYDNAHELVRMLNGEMRDREGSV